MSHTHVQQLGSDQLKQLKSNAMSLKLGLKISLGATFKGLKGGFKASSLSAAFTLTSPFRREETRLYAWHPPLIPPVIDNMVLNLHQFLILAEIILLSCLKQGYEAFGSS